MKAANENRTHIYRIRRKADGLFFVHVCNGHAHGGNPGTWGPNGVFFWKPETVRKHLLELCQFRVYCCEGGVVYDTRKGRRSGIRQLERDAQNPFWVIYPAGTYTTHLVKTMYDWLDLYDVVVTEISVHGDNIMPAREFASFMNDKEAHHA